MATDLGQAYVQIVPSAKGISGSIRGQLDPEASSAGESAGRSIAGSMVKVIGAVIATAGIGKLFSSALSEGADLQQSLGGIETLFKGSADKVKKYADDAYKTAGLSANDYMENVTSFSASLLQSMGGDTEKAADKANMAMVDMSDNANKMGTNMQDIQNAYQGFAKQNYTMLDNLKLGYGGTKEEMSRLLTDAQKLTGVKYDINNLSDVYSAIHAVQEQLDITGTTAKESAETFSGSLQSMKSAFSNVLGKLALGQAIGPELNALAETTSTFLFDNFIPMVGNILKGLPVVFGTLAKEAGKRFTEFLGIDFKIDLSGFKQAIDEALAPLGGMDAVIDGVKGAVSGLVSAFGDMASITIGAAGDFLKWLGSPSGEIARALLSGLAVAIGVVAAAFAVYNIAMGIAAAVTTAFTTVLAVLTSPITLVIAAIAALVAAAILLYNNWDAVKAKAGEVWNAISNTISSILNSIWSFVSSIFSSIASFIGEIWNSIWSTITGIVNNIRNTIDSVFNAISSAVSSVWNTIKSTISNAINGAKDAVSNSINSIKNFFTSIGDIDLFEIGKNVIQGLINGIGSMVKAVGDKISEVAGGIKDKITGALGIHSPSRWMRDMVGKNMMLGWGIGIDNNSGAAFSAVSNVLSGIKDSMRDSFNVGQMINDELASVSNSDLQAKLYSGQNLVKQVIDGATGQTSNADVLRAIKSMADRPIETSINVNDTDIARATSRAMSTQQQYDKRTDSRLRGILI